MVCDVCAWASVNVLVGLRVAECTWDLHASPHNARSFAKQDMHTHEYAVEEGGDGTRALCVYVCVCVCIYVCACVSIDIDIHTDMI